MNNVRYDALNLVLQQGGLATGKALRSCPADYAGALMFVKGDEVVLLEDGPEGTWGWCEGVMGRFKLSHVDFPTLPTSLSPSSDPNSPTSPTDGPEPIKSRRGIPPSFLSDYSLASHGSLGSLSTSALTGESDLKSPFFASREVADRESLEELREDEEGRMGHEGQSDRSMVILDLSEDMSSEPTTPKKDVPGAGSTHGLVVPTENAPRTPGEDSTFEFDSSSPSTTPSDSVASLPPARQPFETHGDASPPITVSSPTETGSSGPRSAGERSFEVAEGSETEVVADSSRPSASHSSSTIHPSSPEIPRRESESSTTTTSSSDPSSGRQSPERRTGRSSAPTSPNSKSRLPPRPAKSPSRKRTPRSSAASSFRSTSTYEDAQKAGTSFLDFPPSSSSSLASLGFPPPPAVMKAVRSSSPHLSTSASTSTISSEGKFEYEVGEIFDAYGRESMYAPPSGWTWQTASEKEKKRMSRALGFDLAAMEEIMDAGEPEVQKPTAGRAFEQRKKRQSIMTFGAVNPSSAPPLPTIPSLSNSTQTSIETSDDSPTTPTAPLIPTERFTSDGPLVVPLPLSPDAESATSPSSSRSGGVHASLGATLLGLSSPIDSPESEGNALGILPSLSPPTASSSTWQSPLNLASDLRKRIQERLDCSPSTSAAASAQGHEPDEELVLVGDRLNNGEKETTVDLAASVDVLPSQQEKEGDEDAWRVAASARNIPALSTSATRTPPALTIDTGRPIALSSERPTVSREPSVNSTSSLTSAQAKEALYGRSEKELGSSPGPVPISFFVGNKTSGVYSRNAYASMSPSPPSTPMGLHPAPSDHAHGEPLNPFSPTVGLFPNAGSSGTTAAPPRPAFFSSRPRSQSFSGQTVEIGFPTYNPSSTGSPRSFATLSSSPKSPNNVNSRPSLNMLGIGANVAIPDTPYMHPALKRRSSDRSSPLCAPPRASSPLGRESPRIASESRFEQLHSLSKPFARGPIDRSVSSKAALPSQQPVAPSSPSSTEPNGQAKKGFKGFFSRSRSRSDARPPIKSELEALQRPPVPMTPASPPPVSYTPPSKPSSRAPDNASPRPSVTSLEPGQSPAAPPPPALEPPSSASSMVSSIPSPALRTPGSSVVSLPSALMKVNTTASNPKPAKSQSTPTETDFADPLQPPRRPSRTAGSSSSIGSHLLAEKTPRSILKSPKSPPATTSAKVDGPPSPIFPEKRLEEQREEQKHDNPSPSRPPSDKDLNCNLPSPREPTPKPSPPAPEVQARSPLAPKAPVAPQSRKRSGPPLDTDIHGFYLRPGQRRPFRLPEDYRESESKWRSILASTPAAALKDKKTKKLVRAGVPPALRGEVWAFFAGTRERHQVGQYTKLLEDAEATELTKIDVERAFADHSYLSNPEEGQRDLLDVMRAYAQFNTRLPYQPSLICVAGVSLLQASPEDAFYLMGHVADKLKGYYDKALQIDSLVWVYLLEAVDKGLARRLVIDCRVNMTKILSRWLLQMFVRFLPFDTLLPIWDVFFTEGVTWLLRIALAVVIVQKSRLLDTHRLNTPQQMEHFLLHLPQDELLSANSLITTADNLKVNTKDDDMKRWRKKAVDTLISSRAAQSERDRRAARNGKSPTLAR